MAGITQLWPATGTPSRAYGSFSGRLPSGRTGGPFTQLCPASATPTRRYGSFAGRGGGSPGTGAFSIFGNLILTGSGEDGWL